MRIACAYKGKQGGREGGSRAVRIELHCIALHWFEPRRGGPESAVTAVAFFFFFFILLVVVVAACSTLKAALMRRNARVWLWCA